MVPTARRCLTSLALLAALAAGTASCGDSDSEADQPAAEASPTASAAEAWASDLCSSLGAWTTTIDQAREQLSEPRDLSVDEVEATSDQVVAASSTLLTQLGSMGAPDTDAGDEAQARLSSLSDDLEAEREVVETAVAEQPSTMQERLQRVSTVTGAAAAMAAEAQSAVADLAALDGAAELQAAFASSDSCQELGR